LLNLDENTVSSIKKFYSQKVRNSKPKILNKFYPITESDMYEFANINNIDSAKIRNFLRLVNEFVQPSSILQSFGYSGKDMGNAISRIEKEFFKNPDEVKRVISSGDKSEINKLIFIKNS
jgi:hypothetical protein